MPHPIPGVVESRTAAMLAPYVGGDLQGNLSWAGQDLFGVSELNKIVTSLAEAKFQVHMHAIGDWSDTLLSSLKSS